MFGAPRYFVEVVAELSAHSQQGNEAYADDYSITAAAASTTASHLTSTAAPATAAVLAAVATRAATTGTISIVQQRLDQCQHSQRYRQPAKEMFWAESSS